MASHTPGAPVFAPPADLPEWAQRSVDLASPRLGARTLGASDDFFAEVARMLNPEPAQFVPGKYDTNGKWMDGWESRRKRVAGHDWAGAGLSMRPTSAKKSSEAPSARAPRRGLARSTARSAQSGSSAAGAKIGAPGRLAMAKLLVQTLSRGG